jgi:glutaredoxin
VIADIAPLLAVAGIVGGFSLLLRRRTGTAAPTGELFTSAEASALGLPHGTASLLLLTAPGCPPCEPAKRLLADVGRRHGIPLAVADVTDHGDLAAAKRVFRAPTAFVLDDRGRAVARISGVPRADELERALDAVGAPVGQ